MRRLALLLVVTAAAAGAGGAWAFFSAGSTAGSSGRAVAATLAPGATPDVALSGRTVTVNWARSALAGSYAIARNGGPAGGTCAGAQSGPSCSDEVPTGRWTYTVAPHLAKWVGAESAPSAQVVVPPEPPVSVALVNGLGAGDAYVDAANAHALAVDVALPATSLATDTVHLVVSDGTASVTATASPAADGAATIHFAGLDAGSLADGTLTLTAVATSAFGDASGATSTTAVKDTVAPSVDVAAGRAADHAGWFNHAVTFTPTATDATSGVASCDPAVAYAGPDGASLTVSRACTDRAGNTGTGTSAAFAFDATAPTVTVTASRSPDVNGWYNHAVTFTPSGADAASGVASCQAAVVYASPDGSGLTVTRTCTDNAGNTGTGTSAAFQFDRTGPTVTVSPSRPPDANGWYDAPVTWTATGTDATSGIVSCQSLAYSGPDSSAVQVSRSCTDAAGNVANGLSPAFRYDATKPTVTAAIASTATNVTGSVAPGGTYVVYADANDALSGVDTSSLTADVSALTGGGPAVPLAFSVAGFTVTNPDGSTSTFHYASAQLTASAHGPGNAAFSVSARDLAANTGTRQGTVALDGTAPTATVALAPGQPSSATTQPVSFVATFSEPVTGLGAGGVVLGGTAGLGSAATVVTRIDAADYAIAVSGLAGPGTVTAAIAAGATTDLAGNANVASAAGPAVTLPP